MQAGRAFADRYLIVGEIGTGGMGTVHRAVDAESGETVALKIVVPETEDERVRFDREARTLDQVRHPNVVRYLAHGFAEDGSCYLAMDWVTGTTLAQRLADPGLTLGESVLVARQLGEALAAVHRLGIVHRDVKPANIMLTGGDVARVRLIDFGVARRIGDANRLTRTGLMVGTPGYMAPEQARGEATIDGRADLFALGCILYECVTGRATFSGEHLTALRAKVLADEPPPPRAFVDDVPEALETLILALLDKNRDARPASAEAFLAALDRVGTPPAGPRRRAYSADAPTRGMPAASPAGVFLVLTDVGGSGSGLGGARARSYGRLADVAAEHGAQVQLISDGRAFGVIRVSGAGATMTEQAAARAGQLALAMRSVLSPSTPVVVSFAVGSDAFGRAVDRAVTLLSDAELGAAAGSTSGGGGVWLDDAAASILAGEFEVEADGRRQRLRGTRGA